jgi:SAM-dependent methyltransferase
MERRTVDVTTKMLGWRAPMGKATGPHWAEALDWRDPFSGRPLTFHVAARHPTGRPHSGALVIEGTREGYPVVDGIPRMTPELAARHRAWLDTLGLEIPAGPPVQPVATVESFGFQWAWNPEPRSAAELPWRVAESHGLTPESYRGHRVLDAGCGAGDESRFILGPGEAGTLVSVELSGAIAVASAKLADNPRWLGIQGDVAHLPFADGAFSFVYCEGVIHHCVDSRATVHELLRVLGPGGWIVATHYTTPESRAGRAVDALRRAIRARLSRLDRPSLLAVTGVLAALAHVPILGRAWGRTVAVANPRHRTFRATWSRTFDAYGSQSFQRRLAPDEFAALFREIPGVTIARHRGGDVVARRATSQAKGSR